MQTIQFKQKYKDINDTLYWLIEQAKVSIPYAAEKFESYDNPRDIFNTFKLVTTYKNDPPGVELIQSLPTLIEDNYHGIPGAGDCDCFATSLIALLWANGFNKINIVLASRTKKYPQHIYLTVIYKDKEYILDATQPYYNSERHYPYKQYLPLF